MDPKLCIYEHFDLSFKFKHKLSWLMLAQMLPHPQLIFLSKCEPITK